MAEPIIPDTLLQEDQTIDPVALEETPRIPLALGDDDTTLFFVYPPEE